MTEHDEAELAKPAPTEPSKLTDWKNEPDLALLKGDFDAALPSHRAQVAKIERWNDLMAVKGSAKIQKVKGRSSVQPKTIRRQNEWRYSALTEPFLSSNKMFSVNPVTFEDVESSKRNGLVLNHQMRTKINSVKFIDDFIRSGVDEGTVFVRTGWVRQTKLVTEIVPVWSYYQLNPQDPEDAQGIELLQQAVQLKAADPRGFNEKIPPELAAAVEYFEEHGEPVTAEHERDEEVQTEEVIENRPSLTVFNPANVVVDPSCEGDLDRANFCIFMIETSKADLLKEGKRYKNLEKVDWESAGPIMDPNKESQTPTDFQFKDALRKKIVMHEYWGFADIHGTGELVPFVASWIGDTIVRMELNPMPDQKLPLVIANYLPVKRELHGEPDAELLEDNQKIMGALVRGMLDLLGRSANSQQGFAKGMLDAMNRRRFDNGQDYEFNPNVSPQVGHIQHKFPDLPASALQMLNLQNQEAEALTGVKSFGGGLSGEAYGDVAAGIKGVLDAAAKREMAILRRFAKAMKDIGQKIIAMNQAFLSEEEVVRITNDQFEVIKREELEGEFDLEVDISTAEIDNAKAQDLAMMLQTMGPNMGIDMVKMILAEIAELKRMPGLAKQIREYQPQQDPVAEALKRLEVAEIEAKIDEIKSKSRLNNAKANEADSKTDLNSLDFVEQETGTKHAREIDRQQAQSRGNQDLAVTNALTKPRKEGEEAPNVAAAHGYNELTDLRDQVRGPLG